MGGTNLIPNAHMTASSEMFPAYYARLHGSSAWEATFAERDAPVPRFYLQVSLAES